MVNVFLFPFVIVTLQQQKNNIFKSFFLGRVDEGGNVFFMNSSFKLKMQPHEGTFLVWSNFLFTHLFLSKRITHKQSLLSLLCCGSSLDPECAGSGLSAHWHLVRFIFLSVVWPIVSSELQLQFCAFWTWNNWLHNKWFPPHPQVFLDYTKEGSSFVFGDLIADVFAFQVSGLLSLTCSFKITDCIKLVLISSTGFANRCVLQQCDVDPLLFGDHAVGHSEGKEVHITLSLHVLQCQYDNKRWFVFLQISWIMQITMGTSPTETLSVAGNIFVGQVLWPKPWCHWYYLTTFCFEI